MARRAEKSQINASTSDKAGLYTSLITTCVLAGPTAFMLFLFSNIVSEMKVRNDGRHFGGWI